MISSDTCRGTGSSSACGCRRGETEVALVARMRVGTRTFELDGIGDSLITAHAALREQVPEARLAAAFRELVERPGRIGLT